LNYTVDEANALGASVFTYPGVNIIKELNGKEIKAQDKILRSKDLRPLASILTTKLLSPRISKETSK